MPLATNEATNQSNEVSQLINTNSNQAMLLPLLSPPSPIPSPLTKNDDESSSGVAPVEVLADDGSDLIGGQEAPQLVRDDPELTAGITRHLFMLCYVV
jgi:hypothetical protein